MHGWAYAVVDNLLRLVRNNPLVEANLAAGGMGIGIRPPGALPVPPRQVSGVSGQKPITDGLQRSYRPRSALRTGLDNLLRKSNAERPSFVLCHWSFAAAKRRRERQRGARETAKMADGGRRPGSGRRKPGVGTGKVNGMTGGSCGTSRQARLASIGRGTGIRLDSIAAGA